jgi:tRNA threonylcarbamoyladenosine biosynthesis protein TsaE
VVIVLGVLWLTSVKANVAIKVKRGTVPLSGTVEIAKSPVSGQMPGRVLVDTFTKIQEYTVADLAGTSSVTLPSDPSGRATATTTAPAVPAPTVPDDQLVAKGTVRLINKYSKAQPLVRTTQLVTEDGKITMVQGLVRAIGVHEAALSPTFVIAQSLKGKFPVHHLDFYRLSAEQILGMGVQDYLTGTGAIEPGLVLIEWAERFSQMWPKDRMEIRIRIRPKSEDREITLTARGERYKEIIGKMK